MVAILGLVISLAFQGQVKLTSSKQLSRLTRPILSVPGLYVRDIVTVSSYTSKESPDPTVVYRFVFKGSLQDTLRSFQANLTKRDGWTMDMSNPKEPCLQRNLPTGPVKMQALIFHGVRLIPDEKGGHPVQGPFGKGWIWISYNEGLRPEKKHSAK